MKIKRYSHASQCQFQLDSINRGLRAVLQQKSLLFSDNATYAGFTPVLTQSTVRVDLNHSPALPGLEFAPLFPGSFTQSDVTVSAIVGTEGPTLLDITSLKSTQPVNHSADKAPSLSALDPILHFARFNGLPRKLATSIRKGRKPIAIVIDESATLTTKSRENLKHRLRQFIGKSGGHQDIVVAQLNINTRSHKSLWSKRVKTADFHISAQVSVHPIVISSPEVMMALLAKSAIALVPSVSLAMDAANAGCTFLIYGEQKLPDRLFHSAMLDGSHLISEQQRTRLMQSQIDSAQAKMLVNSKHHMYLVLSQWISAQQQTSNAWLDLSKQLHLAEAIIPVNSARGSNVRDRLTRTQSKLRKLLHSPRQFLQDSNIVSLRRLVGQASNRGR